MRNFTEPTAKNLLRPPMVLGVPYPGLLVLAFLVLSILMVAGSSQTGSLVALGMGVAGYGALRVAARVLRPGWEESLLYPLERLLQKKGPAPVRKSFEFAYPVLAPDTLDTHALISAKEELREFLEDLEPGSFYTLHCRVSDRGARLEEYRFEGPSTKASNSSGLWPDVFSRKHVYSLTQLPVGTDPIWLWSQLSRLNTDFDFLVAFRGIDFQRAKRRVEHSRRRCAADGSRLRDVDSEITFSEATAVLERLSRGDELILEASIAIVSDTELPLDSQYFSKETNRVLALESVSGLRPRFLRSFWVRSVTATDLVPTVLDPMEKGVAILKTPRGKDLYFDPQDRRLEALHWVVVGASGSGKSFLTGLILKRMIDQGVSMSVLFVDHNRSFQRFVRSLDGVYAEPETISQYTREVGGLLSTLETEGTVCGIELSDLGFDEKKAVTSALLLEIEAFLRNRNSFHPVYVVIDECWNFLRDEPVAVQRAFREYRKLDGAVVAVTQSLSDLLSTAVGPSILQNAPIRILLRQGEDAAPYRGVLGLNDVEIGRLRTLRQVRGEFSECLIKTPFLSRLGRLHPTEAEHELLRTDNLRAERVRALRPARNQEVPCDC